MSNSFQIGDWMVDPDSGRLIQDGDEIKLEPKVMAVLVCLAQHPGKVVSRETLDATVWSGLVVGYDAISASIIKLRKAFGDDPRQPRFIETVSNKGYRLIAPVTHDVTAPDPFTLPDVQQTADDNPFDSKTSLIKTLFGSKQLLGSIFLLAGIIVMWQLIESGADKLRFASKAPAIAVLPFENIGRDPAQEYFSDGITDDLITDLSRVGSLRVIAKESAYHYKQAKKISLADVGRELSVQYIVQGSVQKAKNRIRINVRLTNVSNGEVMWAERFDSQPENIFDTQDKITQRVIKAMTVTMPAGVSKPAATSETRSFAAYDTFLLGQKYIGQRSKEGYEMAMSAYKGAVALDPDFARVYSAMAVALTYGYRFQWTDLSLGEARERSLKLVNKAVALDQSSPQIYWALGYVHLHRKEYVAAEAAAKRAVELSPSYADGYGLLAYIANWRGKAKQAETYIKQATVLNPYHSFDYPWNLGLSYYHQGRYQEAVSALKDALERNANALYPRLFLAASYVRLGRLEDAQWEIENIKVNRADTTLTHLHNLMPFEHKQDLDAVLNDLRQAGLPE